MLYSLRGKLVHFDQNSLAIECGGVAYYCLASFSTLSKMPKTGEEVHVFTHLNIRQDAAELFAFSDRAELNCFRMLTGVSGVGPKAALAILSCLDPQRFALCVSSGDFKSITRAQGVGPKLAQRIVLELRDKIAKSSIAEVASGAAVTVMNASGPAAEAVGALVVLGYSQADAARAVAGLDPALPVEEMIRSGLIALAKKI